MNIAQTALQWAIAKLGYPYNQKYRMQSGYFDCSSLIDRAFAAAGYPFQTDQNTSCYLCYDPGFDRIWPEAGKTLGKQLTSITSLKKNGYTPEPGDVIFYNTDSKTTRSNKITHVAFVENEKTIVHARGTAYGVRRDSIDLYGEKVVCVMRFREADMEADNLGNFLRAAICTGDDVNIRQGRSSSTQSNGKISAGHPVVILGKEGDKWPRCVTLELDGTPLNGYIFAEYTK